MDQELKTKWIAALRSGEFKQTINQLKRNVGGEPAYCCLGVLCEVAGHQIGEYDNDQQTPTHFYNLLRTLIGDGHVSALAKMNDNARLSFDRIADYIEKNL